MQPSFNLTNATASFGFNSGDNPNRDIITRQDATATFLGQTAKASKIAFTIPAGVATVDTQFLNIVPANSVVTDLKVIFRSAVDFGAGGTLNLAVGTASGGAELCASVLTGAAGGSISTGAATGISSIAATGGAVFVFETGTPVYFVNGTSLFIRSVVGVNAMAGAATCSLVVSYTTL